MGLFIRIFGKDKNEKLPVDVAESTQYTQRQPTEIDISATPEKFQQMKDELFAFLVQCLQSLCLLEQGFANA